MHRPTHACAQAILTGLPPVMWFIRRHMRLHRVEGLSVPQFRILALLDHQPHTSQACVGEHLGCTAPTASRLVGRLIAKKLVAREQCSKDRRLVRLDLTPRGRKVLEAARESTRERLAGQVSHLSERDLARVTEAMKLIAPIFAAEFQKPQKGEAVPDCPPALGNGPSGGKSSAGPKLLPRVASARKRVAAGSRSQSGRAVAGSVRVPRRAAGA